MKLFSLLPRRLSHFACNSPISGTLAGPVQQFAQYSQRILLALVKVSRHSASFLHRPEKWMIVR